MITKYSKVIHFKGDVEARYIHPKMSTEKNKSLLMVVVPRWFKATHWSRFSFCGISPYRTYTEIDAFRSLEIL